MATFGDQTVLLVERFNRARMDDGAGIAHLPQEDFCQALGVSPKQKYAHHARTIAAVGHSVPPQYLGFFDPRARAVQVIWGGTGLLTP